MTWEEQTAQYTSCMQPQVHLEWTNVSGLVSFIGVVWRLPPDSGEGEKSDENGVGDEALFWTPQKQKSERLSCWKVETFRHSFFPQNSEV